MMDKTSGLHIKHPEEFCFCMCYYEPNPSLQVQVSLRLKVSSTYLITDKHAFVSQNNNAIQHQKQYLNFGGIFFAILDRHMIVTGNNMVVFY